MLDSGVFLFLLLKHIMTKRKGPSIEEKLIKALRELPNPLEDKKHRIRIYFIDNRARSNESRFEHISLFRHNLQPSDIERISRHINRSTLKKDPERNNTYNLYIKRKSNHSEYIKISLELDFTISNEAVVKTIFITTHIK